MHAKSTISISTLQMLTFISVVGPGIQVILGGVGNR